MRLPVDFDTYQSNPNIPHKVATDLWNLSPKGTPMARVAGFSTQSIRDNTDTAVTWVSIDYDWPDGSMWDPSTPTRLSAPVDGIYVATGGTQFSVNATGSRTIYIFQGGGVRAIYSTGGNASSLIAATVTSEFAMAKGDYVELHVVQTSGAALALSNTYPSFLALRCLRPS